MEYLILAIAVSFTVANSLVLRVFRNRDIRNTGDSLLFNGGISAIWVAVIFVWGLISNRGLFPLSAQAAFYGALYGLDLSLFLLFKCQSIVSGPVSLSALIGACGFIISTIFSAICYREEMSVIRIVGMCLILAAIILCVNPKRSGMVLTTKWKIYAFFYFVTGGMIGIINKLFQHSDAKTELDGMMLVASVTSALVLTLAGFALNKALRKPAPRITVRNLVFVGLCGLLSCVYCRLNVLLAGLLPGAVLFPVSNGGVIFLSSAISVLAFREKLSLTQWAGILLGIASIVLIGVF